MESISILVKKSCGGDREAFARIVAKYQGMVSAVTLNVVGNYAQSEDLAQETFLTAWTKLPELREPERLASWLYGIARRVALRWTEKQQRNPLHSAAEIDAETLTDRQIQADAGERHHREQSLALVWSTVKELPETLREPLLLYYRYSKSVADIAATLSLTEDAVHQRLSRGRKMLKAEVEKQVETVLESTGPGEYFVLGVLAGIPILTVTPEVFAATSAAGSAGAAAKSSGGVPLLAKRQ
jgi:RNA polymerase sigma factor (sigma-70 family)